jgi:cellulose synthase/poly-beta-1,6-N-acetylglucosamine synthase-like glycosyltransferase
MISTIISFYKALDNLELILQAMEKQSFDNFEVIVAEDNNNPQTVAYLSAARQRFRFPILHVFQEDKGFRKCKILNEAIKVASGSKIVFLDGDCLPHRHLLRQYNRYITKNTFCTGRRLTLSPKMSDKILSEGGKRNFTLWECLLNGCKDIKRGIYFPYTNVNQSNKRKLLGCNMGGEKSDLLQINGFDEDYIVPGYGEDSDLDWRLRRAGIKIKTVFYACIVYHLHHPLRYFSCSPEQTANRLMFAAKQEAGQYFCANGLQKQ